MRLYKEIREVYKRLPEKDRKIVHNIINDYWIIFFELVQTGLIL
jgi:hypothetical protein